MYYFNSQPHKGADPAMLSDLVIVYISTHSPTKGLTPALLRLEEFDEYFNSQPHKGADNIR